MRGNYTDQESGDAYHLHLNFGLTTKAHRVENEGIKINERIQQKRDDSGCMERPQALRELSRKV